MEQIFAELGYWAILIVPVFIVAALVIFGKVLWSVIKVVYALSKIAIFALIAIGIVYLMTKGTP